MRVLSSFVKLRVESFDGVVCPRMLIIEMIPDLPKYGKQALQLSDT